MDEGVDIELDEAPSRSDVVPAERPTLKTFAGYEILGRMAVGGMAEVFVARERGGADSQRSVALKVIRAQLSADPAFGEMFLREGRVALGLRHPNLCHVYRFGVERGHPFLAMELVDGVTLRDLLNRARRQRTALPPHIAAKIASSVAEALHSAHVARDEHGRVIGLVHQDVSPHNVMVGYDGTVKLLDFGVASTSVERERESTESSHSTIRGKAGYLSPEQCTGTPVDARSDVFSLGIVLYEMLTGGRLFARAQTLDAMHAIACEPLPTWPASVPAPLARILDRALSRDRDRRYASAAALQEDLERYLAESRAIVTSARIADTLATILGDELGAPPDLDTSPEIVAWLRDEERVEELRTPSTMPAPAPTATPHRSRRGLLIGLVAGGAIAVTATAIALVVGAGASAPSAPQAMAATSPQMALAPVPVEPTLPVAGSAPETATPEQPSEASDRPEDAPEPALRGAPRPGLRGAARPPLPRTTTATSVTVASAQPVAEPPPVRAEPAGEHTADFVDDPGF